MDGWILLWKVVFILGLSIFFVMSVWVTFGGFHDIKKFFSTIRKSHEV